MIYRLLVFVMFCAATCGSGQSAPAAEVDSSLPPLRQVADLKLRATCGSSFDHMAVDVQRQRLLLAAEDDKAVLVLDLSTGDIISRIPVTRPHSILYRADLDRVYVTDGVDGSLRVFEGKDYHPLKRIALQKGADSIGFDISRKLLYVANGGDGAQDSSLLSIIDISRGEKLKDLRIHGKVLGDMALDAYRPRLYINDRTTGEVVVIDRYREVEVSRWRLQGCTGNVAIALDEQRQRLFVGCHGGKIAVLDSNTGQELQTLAIHNGVDDLIYDPIARRLYASSDGFLDVFDQMDLNHYQSRGSELTSAMAHTSQFVPEMNRLLVVAPKHGDSAAHVAVFEPENTLPLHLPPNDVKEPVSAPVAEQIIVSELSKHPTLRRMGLHVIPPGQQTMILIANGNETRLGIHTSQGDFDAVKTGGIYGPRIADGEFYNMKMPMFDREHHDIGILVMEIPCTSAASEKDAARQADRIREEVAAQIPSLSSLFLHSTH